MVITKDTLIGDILRKDAGYAEVLQECGMHCITCPSAAYETLEEASDVHGLFVEDVLEAIEEYNEACAQWG